MMPANRGVAANRDKINDDRRWPAAPLKTRQIDVTGSLVAEIETPVSAQAAQTAAYQRNPYPSFIHPLTHPDRLATIARLSGLDAPDIGTARVLEVGVGDGLNLLSMAQALPDASFVGFDIEAEGIGRGRERVAAVGQGNVRLEVADLMNGAPEIEGSFDYIIAHGVFAWVPEPVALALLALIGERLAPNGVAFVSFNALPGSYATQAVREAMMRAAGNAENAEERLERARALLRAIAEPRGNDGQVQKGLRIVARERLERDARVLVHDELSTSWHPWHLSDVLDRSREHGLMFLGDASAELVVDGILMDQAPAPAPALQQFVEARACADDDLAFRQFRRLLLTRDDALPRRHVDPRVIEGLFAASYAEEVEPETFAAGPRRIRCDHPPLRDALRRLIAASPERIPVRDLGLDDAYLRALIGLFDYEMLSLHTVPTSCSPTVRQRPKASPLARVMVSEGMDWAATLDHRVVALDAGAKEVLAMLDGSTEREDVYARLSGRGFDGEAAVAGLAGIALLTR